MKSGLRLLLRAAVSVAIIVVLWHTVPFGAALAALMRVDAARATVGLLLAAAVVATGAAQIHTVTGWQGLSISAPTHVKITLQTGFYSLFLPGTLSGGVIRWYKLARPDRKPAEAISAIIYNRMIGMIVVTGIGLLCWLDAEPVELGVPVGLLFAACLAGLTGFYATAFNRRLYAWIVDRVPPRVLDRVPDVLTTRIRRTLDAMTAFDGMPARVRAMVFAWALAKHLIGIAVFVAFAASLDVDIAYVDAGWVRSLTSLVLLLPITVAGIGVRESATIVLLAPLGVPGPTALALSVVLFAHQVLLGLVGGLLEARDAFRARAAADEGAVTPAGLGVDTADTVDALLDRDRGGTP